MHLFVIPGMFLLRSSCIANHSFRPWKKIPCLCALGEAGGECRKRVHMVVPSPDCIWKEPDRMFRSKRRAVESGTLMLRQRRIAKTYLRVIKNEVRKQDKIKFSGLRYTSRGREKVLQRMSPDIALKVPRLSLEQHHKQSMQAPGLPHNPDYS